jgi:acyl-CoA dehydrogenase
MSAGSPGESQAPALESLAEQAARGAAFEAAVAALVQRARALGRSAGPSLFKQAEQDPHGLAAARQALRLLADAGLLAAAIAPLHGGLSLPGQRPGAVSVRALCALREELAYHNGMLDLMLVMAGLGSYPLQLGGADELRQRWLPGVQSGRCVAAYGLTEPGAGSSLDEIATRAERVPGGYRLSGHKTFISNAGLADFYTVLARTAGQPGDKGRDNLSMFLVPASAASLEAKPFEVLAPHPIGDVHLTGVFVPAAERLGAEGQGLEIALETLATFRTTVAAAANGFSRRALAESVGHLERRSQFGKPLAQNQALRFEIAEMDTDLAAARLLVAEAARLADAEDPAAPRAVSRAKLFATEAAGRICDRAVQHHGGLGVKRGSVVEDLYREVRALRIYEGTSEIQKLILSKHAFEEHRPA